MINLERIIILLFILLGLSGCKESSFKLSEDSRLPLWFEIPEGMKRSDYTAKMDLHSTFEGGKLVMIIYKKNQFFPVDKQVITSNEQPKIQSTTLNNQSGNFPTGYPRYKIITINGITDIVELRQMEPVFYMTDNPSIWEGLGVPLN